MSRDTLSFAYKKLIKKIAFLFVSFAMVFVLGASSAFAASYSCPTSNKKYTSCNAGYYLSSSSYGNSCASCSSAKNTTSTRSGTESCSKSCSIANGTCTYSNCTQSYTDTCSGYYTGGGGGTTVGSSSCTGCSAYSRTSTGTCGGCTISITCNTGYTLSGNTCVPKEYSCEAGKYLNGTTCTTCTGGYYCKGGSWTYNGGIQGRNSCSTDTNGGYPNSAAGAAAITSCYSGTKSRAWSGGQNACSKPSNCATVTCNTCSIAACDYVAYSNSSGNGDGTIKSGCSSNSANCNQTVKSVTANVNAYVDGTSCKTCSSFSSTYTKSAGGNIGRDYCFKEATKTGSQLPCNQPANSYTYTCNACTPGTCLYRDYYNATDTTCTPISCEQTATVTSCAASYYKDGNACYACSGLASGFYPNSNAGNSSGASACYTNSLSGKIIKTAYASTTETCGAGYYKPAHNVNYGSTSGGCGTCTGTTYSGAGAASCTSCPNSATGYYSWDGDTLHDSVYECYKNVTYTAAYGSGTQNCYYTSGSGTSAVYAGNSNMGCESRKITSCNAGYWLASSSNTDCSAVGKGYWSGAGSTTRTECANKPSNSDYTSATTNTSSSCPWVCNPGYNGSSAQGSSSCSTCASGSYCSGGTQYSCPNPWTYAPNSFPDDYYSPSVETVSIESGTGLSAITQCKALYWYTSSRGKFYEYSYYSSSAGRYTAAGNNYWGAVNAGYYLTDKAGCGNYAYYSTVKPCPADSYCPGKDYTTCNSSNQSTVHTTNFGLYDCPSGYPNSAAGATAITSCYSGTKSRAWSGGQNACSKPSNCATVTCNTCSIAACNYVAYSNSAGNGDGTVKSGCSSNSANCNQTVKSVTANVNAYVDGTSCKTCSSFSSTYTKSDGGNIGSDYCFKEATKTGSQLACSQPSNSVSYTCGTCSPGTCTYKDYYSATDTTCTPSNCTKPVASATCKANYYGTTSCTACDPSYPYSDQGTTSDAYCYASKTSTGSQLACSQPSNSVSYTCGTCSPGTCSWRDYKSATDTTCTPSNCTKPVASATCRANYYGTTSCTACDPSYPYSDQGTTSDAYCYASKTKTGSQIACSKPANSYTHTCNSCTPGTCSLRDYKSATDTNCTPTNCTQTATVTGCAASYYKDGNACYACSGLANGLYPNSDNGNSSGTSACRTNSLSGKIIKTANATTTTDCDTKYYKTAHTVNYGSTSSCETCPATASGSDSGRDAKTDCYVSCSAKTISNGTTTVVNAKEYYNGSAYPACTFNVSCDAKYGASGNKTSNPACTACSTGQYSAGGTATCTACTNGPAHSEYTNSASSNSCSWKCNSGYNQTDDNQCGQFCTSGITHLKTGSGVSVPLYTSARTTPALNVKVGSNSICYGSLATGKSTGALNVKVGSTTYHAIK